VAEQESISISLHKSLALAEVLYEYMMVYFHIRNSRTNFSTVTI